MDEAALVGRLRHAIAAEDGEEEEQLNGVLRMLGAQIPDKKQLPLFGKPPAGQKPSSEARVALETRSEGTSSADAGRGNQ